MLQLKATAQVFGAYNSTQDSIKLAQNYHILSGPAFNAKYLVKGVHAQ